jgi:hypothetical protein
MLETSAFFNFGEGQHRRERLGGLLNYYYRKAA